MTVRDNRVRNNNFYVFSYSNGKSTYRSLLKCEGYYCSYIEGSFVSIEHLLASNMARYRNYFPDTNSLLSFFFCKKIYDGLKVHNLLNSKFVMHFNCKEETRSPRSEKRNILSFGITFKILKIVNSFRKS